MLAITVAADAIPSASPSKLTGRRHWIVVTILVLAIITGFGAIISTWLKRQVLDTHHWTATTSKLLANDKIDAALGAYLADQLFTQVDVADQIRGVLPAPAQGLAAPAAAGLREIAERRAPELLTRPAVQDAWLAANTAAHAQLVKLLNGGGANVSTKNGNVVLNLHNIVDQLAAQLGVEKQVAAAREKLAGAGGAAQNRLNIKVPASTGQLTVLRSDELKAAQNGAKGLKSISIVLTALSLGLFALSVYLSGAHRRVALRTVGWSFVGMSLAALLARRVLGNQVVDSLAQTESIKPAAHEAWSIASSLLYTIAISGVVYGLVLVVAPSLAGPSRMAVASRRALAAPLRERPGLIYINAAAIYLLVLVWGPTPAFRNWLPVLIIAALLILGIEALRH